jgi:hypothetical protein
MNLPKQMKITQLLSPAATVTATGASSVLTMVPCDRVTFLVNVGAVAAGDASNYFLFTVLEGTVVGTQAGVPEACQYIGDWDRKINATGEADAVYSFDFIPTPGKNFLKVAFTETSTASAIFSITAIEHAKQQPV